MPVMDTLITTCQESVELCTVVLQCSTSYLRGQAQDNSVSVCFLMTVLCIFYALLLRLGTDIFLVLVRMIVIRRVTILLSWAKPVGIPGKFFDFTAYDLSAEFCEY